MSKLKIKAEVSSSSLCGGERALALRKSQGRNFGERLVQADVLLGDAAEKRAVMDVYPQVEPNTNNGRSAPALAGSGRGGDACVGMSISKKSHGVRETSWQATLLHTRNFEDGDWKSEDGDGHGKQQRIDEQVSLVALNGERRRESGFDGRIACVGTWKRMQARGLTRWANWVRRRSISAGRTAVCGRFIPRNMLAAIRRALHLAAWNACALRFQRLLRCPYALSRMPFPAHSVPAPSVWRFTYWRHWSNVAEQHAEVEAGEDGALPSHRPIAAPVCPVLNVPAESLAYGAPALAQSRAV
ncbi:hypothetical protein HYPSUDRAFT_201440 [Hypholoma sublateritium FD-334 SS-4]|uniref:Uncharacterized protein n=1 Tax=Hypholoma sublateritium (strain FD-334 SS-4) TaxID=945553 RepID=A0A0D2MID6_HYPSF|nr:hypothetical protein HYPSUDRAFT_201440 [Hypholoma sublateritium FD-334 SS-4]